jgi:hypothetical protein
MTIYLMRRSHMRHYLSCQPFYHAFLLLLILVTALQGTAQQNKKELAMTQATVWKDTEGAAINAHGAGMLYHDGIYYLFGEIKKGKTWLVPGQSWEAYRVNAGGVSCYTSKDLVNWQYKGVALAPNTTDSLHDLHTSKVIERPKVIYNKRTGKFVMWMHIDKEDYSYAHAGVAVSDRPEGPYQFIESMRPNGNMSRDMTLFKDDDEKAYLIYASENNLTMHVCRLSDDYLKPTSSDKRILVNENREAPALFKQGGTYYLITSACTGWSPNKALYAIANAPMGDWKQSGNPCTGPNADSTSGAQSTFVLPVSGKKDTYIFMADQWNKTDLENSRYIWLPLQVTNGKPIIKWTREFVSPLIEHR